MSFQTCDGVDASPRRAAPRGHGGSRIVDIHCHMSVPEAAALMKPLFRPEMEPALGFNSQASIEVNHAQHATIAPKLATAEAKIADMDRLGVDMQLLSPAPAQYYYWAEPDAARQAARMINDKIAATVAAHPDRFAGLGTIPMQDPQMAVAELRRCMGELGLKGVEISTSVSGAELSEERFRPFFAAAEELSAFVFMHPMGFSHGERLNQHYFNNVIGNPLDTTVAVSHLIFGGVLDDHPGLRICLAHGGAYLASYSGRMDHAYRTRSDCQCCKRLPSSYLKDFWYDTVVFDPDQLRALVARYGADRVLMGSDYPFDMGEPDPVGFVRSAGLGEATENLILGGNATMLLGLRHPVATATA